MYLYLQAMSLSSAQRPLAKQGIVRIPQTGNDEHSVKSAAQITNFNSLQSLLLIRVLLREAFFEGYVTLRAREMKGTFAFSVSSGRQTGTGRPDLCEPRQQLCTNKP